MVALTHELVPASMDAVSRKAHRSAHSGPYDIVPPWHYSAAILCRCQSGARKSSRTWHTIVIGMLGAFGKMNLTSSNLFRRRQFSANDTLSCEKVETFREQDLPSSTTALIRQPEAYTVRVLEADLSPSPCSMITVAVCFDRAFTISGRSAILSGY